MAKKIVRGITDVKTITNQDFDTNNVNDLLSDGQYNYIHRKKGKNEEYHNLTDNIKTISSDNTELLSVTNYNKTTNTATLHPKHDKQKEQVIESTRDTITINHGTNGTDEKTTVDTNPEKVLEHTNLLTDYGISKNTTGNTTTLGLEYTKVTDDFELNNLVNGRVIGYRLLNAPNYPGWYFVESVNEGIFTYQKAISLYATNHSYVRFKESDSWGEWRPQVGDSSVIDGLLAQKQNTLTAMGGISITGDSISLTTIDQYREDLNNLNYTCLAKPIDDAPNLPTGAAGHGILKVVRISDVVSQQYHTYNNNSLYTRTCRNADSTPEWTPWVKVTTADLT